MNPPIAIYCTIPLDDPLALLPAPLFVLSLDPSLFYLLYHSAITNQKSTFV